MPPAAPQPEAEPLAEADRSAQPAQQPSAAQPEARHEEDAVDRAAAAQLRLAAQSASQGKVPERPAPLEATSSGPVDAAVAKQSSISAKLAGASVPSLDHGAAAAAAAAEADRASSGDSSTSNYTDAGSASSQGAAPSSESTTPRSAGKAMHVQACLVQCGDAAHASHLVYASATDTRLAEYALLHGAYTLLVFQTYWGSLRRPVLPVPRGEMTFKTSAAARLKADACAGGAAARSSAVRSRVRSAGARQRRGGASADGSPRTPAAPQELRENDQVPMLSLNPPCSSDVGQKIPDAPLHSHISSWHLCSLQDA